MDKYKHITAEWARQTSANILGEKANKQLNECFTEIEVAVQNNLNSITYYENLNQISIQELEKRGFKVKHYSGDFRDHLDNGNFVISW